VAGHGSIQATLPEAHRKIKIKIKKPLLNFAFP
jgi:hypothetical protein